MCLADLAACFRAPIRYTFLQERCRNLCTLVWFCKRRLAWPAKIEEINERTRSRTALGSRVSRIDPISNFLKTDNRFKGLLSQEFTKIHLGCIYYIPNLWRTDIHRCKRSSASYENSSSSIQRDYQFSTINSEKKI